MRVGVEWTTPNDLLAQLRRLWERGLLLRGGPAPGGTSADRIPLRLRKPTRRELGERFGEVQAWIRALETGSKQLGYEVEYEEIDHRQLGKNRIPARASISAEKALRALGKTRAADRYLRLVQEIADDEFPELAAWLDRKPLVAIEADWPRLLAVLRFFRARPRPGVYRRQLEIEGVDTKFIEENRRLLGELLPLVLPSEMVLGAPGISFDRRFGLLDKPTLLRFRILDERLHIHGFSDLTVPVQELAQLELPVDEVIVTENETNALALPSRPRSIVIFGRGYASDLLAELPWLNQRRLLYWGDIDTHGFAILDRFRAYFPRAESLLMDAETFHAHRTMWVQETTPTSEPLTRLSSAEAALYDDLVRGVHGERLRLEQERIAFPWVRRHLEGQ